MEVLRAGSKSLSLGEPVASLLEPAGGWLTATHPVLLPHRHHAASLASRVSALRIGSVRSDLPG